MVVQKNDFYLRTVIELHSKINYCIYTSKAKGGKVACSFQLHRESLPDLEQRFKIGLKSLVEVGIMRTFRLASSAQKGMK